MAGSTKQPWYLHGDWPLTSNDEVTGEHFEDIRKFCFVLMHPDTGHHPETFFGYDDDHTETVLPSDIPATDYKVGEIVIKTSRTKVWESDEAISKGCWRSISVTGDTYEALTDLTAGENTTSPDSSANWRQITDPPAFEFTNTVLREWDTGVPSAANFKCQMFIQQQGCGRAQVWLDNEEVG